MILNMIMIHFFKKIIKNNVNNLLMMIIKKNLSVIVMILTNFLKLLKNIRLIRLEIH